MKIYDAVTQTNKIKNEFNEYLRSTFDIRDQEYKDLFIEQLDRMEEKLYKGPYLCSSLPFLPGKSIKQLVDCGVVHSSFLKLDCNPDRPLYQHQIDAIQKIEDGKSVVVTTGTGSGKTESFLFPVIDQIIKEIEESGVNDPGIRAIMLFPMNALINDQIERVSALLKPYPKIKYAFFTGETKHGSNKNEHQNQDEQFLSTRAQIRKTPPHILFTNYSMLEYLLIRPEEKELMSSEYGLKYLRFFVLDEAHTYHGTNAIEISYLLRRLEGVAKKRLQYVLTSATLGNGIQDEKEIIEFAHRLTSAYFDSSSVVYATRVSKTAFTRELQVNPSDYLYLLEHYGDYASTKNIFDKYGLEITGDFQATLFSLLKKDINTYRLYEYTDFHHPIEYREVLYKMNLLEEGFNDENLLSLIGLIAKLTSTNNFKIFDIKYHTFLKAPDACYITVGNDCQKKMSLTKTNYIGDKRAFKIGICQSCRIPYLMGIVDEGHILVNDDEIDIDETYEEKSKKIEYFLLEDSMTKDEIDLVLSMPNSSEKILCSKCGRVENAKHNHGWCECGDQFKTLIIKYCNSKIVDGDDQIIADNNINQCPICDFKGRGSGVVMGFHVGKDRATSLISQILYQSMESKTETITKFSRFKKCYVEQEVKVPKQFLAFSDSRQQAAFFSKFTSENNDRFLKKAIVRQILEKNGYQPLTVTELKPKIQDIFINELGYQPEEAAENAMATILWELLNVDGKNSAEGLGLFAYSLDIGEVYEDEELPIYLSEEGFPDISVKEFTLLTKIVLDVFRTVPAINYPPFAQDPQKREELLGYRQYSNTVMLQNVGKKEREDVDSSNTSSVKSLLPISEATPNKLVKFVQKAFGYDMNKAKKLIRLVWDTAEQYAGLFVNISDGGKDIGKRRIQFDRYSVHSYKENRFSFYVCDKCHNVTPLNLRNKCIEGDCPGTLSKIDPDQYFANNYYRKQYLTKPIENVVCFEHTAQISSEEAKDRQKQFKDKKINILSCSTTFEMGIDLGDLSTVFLRNVPPRPSNYAQRAGRAGRRADTPAYVLTFCSSSSHDYAYFSDPTKMISGIVQPPYFNAFNPKVIIRHINAAALGNYYRKYPEKYSTIGNFVNNGGFDDYRKYLSSKPSDLLDYIDNYLLREPELKNIFGNWAWLNSEINESSVSMNNMFNSILENIKQLENARDEALSNKKGLLADKYSNELNKLNNDNSLVTYLSEYNVIPHYGFPIDNVEFKIWDAQENKISKKYPLSRGLNVAISEYAPDSEIIVDNKKYTSHYIAKTFQGLLPAEKRFIVCGYCDSANITDTSFPLGAKCKCCNSPLQTNLASSYLVPERGFIGNSINKNTRRLKPARTYASDIKYVGTGTQEGNRKLFNNTIWVSSFKNEELFVVNNSQFYVCDKCGYSRIIKKARSDKFVISKNDHKAYDGSACDSDHLTRTAIGNKYKTDVVVLNFVDSVDLKEQDTAISTLMALLEGMSLAFEVDRDDIGGLIHKHDPNGNYDFILFDTVVGGAGHIKRLQNGHDLVSALNSALSKVDRECCAEDTSCYNCLRSYSNQSMHSHLKRGLARDTLKTIIDSIENGGTEIIIGDPQATFNNYSEMVDACNSYFEDEDYYQSLRKIIEYLGDKSSDYYPCGFVNQISYGNKKGHVLASWPEKRVAIFSPEQYELYDTIKSVGSYKCFCLDNSFDINLLIGALEA